MSIKILLVHAHGEQEIAAKIAQPLRVEGYEVFDDAAVQLGESLTEAASRLLMEGAPVVMCATVRAVGTRWARMVTNAARQYPSVKLFIMQIDQDADVDTLSFGEKVGRYWENPVKAVEDLITALKPQSRDKREPSTQALDIVKNYADILLKSCDIINLANLPETDRYRVAQQLELRRLYVALRVQLELSSDDEPSSKNIGDIESRREILRRGKAPWARFNHDLAGLRRNRFAIGERLAVSRSLVVLGDPGSGKTTLLRWIATAYLLRLKKDTDWEELPDALSLPTEDWLPILIRCRDLNQNTLSTSLEELLRHNVRRAEIPEAEASQLVPILIQKLKDGKAILLIDGLDEITDITVRASFCHQIEQMRLAHANAPIVVTSRIVGYREMGQRIGRGFEHVSVAELSKKDKNEFARLWCNLTETGERRQEAAAELIREIDSTDRIERLTTNPMLLTTIALVKRKVGRLPTHRVDLYGDALAVLLNWRREVDQPLDWYEAVPQLGYLAYSMCNRGILQLRKDEILELLQSIRTQYPALYAIHAHTPEQFLNLLERLTGVLTQVGTVRHVGLSIPVYEFRHLTFQEYLAARALIDGCYPDRDRQKNLAETIAPLAGRFSDETRYDRDVTVSESWSETLRLCVAACPNDDVDQVLRAIARPYQGEDLRATRRPRAILASLCLADDPNVSEEVAREVIESLVGEVEHKERKDDTDTGISTAVRELSSSRWAEILRSALLAHFRRSESMSKANLALLYGAVVTFGLELKDEAQRAAWLETEIPRLFSESEVDQIDALLSINAIAKRHYITPPKTLIERLLAQLTSSAPLALAAASTLATLNSTKQTAAAWRPLRREIDMILNIVQSENSDVSVVENLLTIVGREQESRALKPVLSKLVNPHLRLAAVEALGRIGGKDVATRLIPLLSSDDNRLRLTVTKALGRLGDESGYRPLISQLNQGSYDLRIATAEALGNFQNKKVAAALIECLNDTNSEMRESALEALHRIGQSEYSDIYISMLNDVSVSVRTMAVGCIHTAGDPGAVDILLPKLNDPSDEVQAAVAVALGESKDPRVVQPLIHLLRSDNDLVYLATAVALGRLRDHAAIDPLIAGLDSPHLLRRFGAAMALGWLRDEKVIEPLLQKLTDQKELVQSIFALPLTRFKNPRLFEPASALLMSSDDSTRESAVQILGEMKDERALDLLFNSLHDESSVVREATVSALSHYKDDRILSALLAATNDPSLNVRIAAVDGLRKLEAPESTNRLIDLLNDYSASIREAAVKSIVTLNAQSALPVLIRRLLEENTAVKATIIEALKDMNDIQAVKPLLTEASSDDEKIGSLASRALNSMGIAQFVQGKIEHTIQIFSALAEINSGDNSLHNNLAFCFMLQGNYKSAYEQISLIDFEEVSDDRPLYQNNRALLTFIMGEPQKAKKQLRKALRWIIELKADFDPHGATAVLVLKSPQRVSSHEGVPVDVAILINLYLMSGLTRLEASRELSKRYPSNVKWEELLDDVDSQFLQTEMLS